MFGRGESRSGATPWQTLAVVAMAVVTLVLCVVALTRDPAPPARAVDEASGAIASDEPSADPSEAADDPSAGATEQEPADPPPPAVEDARRVDFGNTDRLPDDSRLYDNESVGSGIAVEDGVLQHGQPRGPVAVSSLETELGADVQKVGARVRFSGQNPGSVVLVAWQSSFIDSREANLPIPQTGLRLVASSGSWELTASPADDVIATGEFSPVQGTATFELYRSGQQAWVVDPSGATTYVEDPRVERLAGPWACWQLMERETTMTPVAIESVWAG